MKILYIQETDFLEKGPQQQHHLLERLSVQGHHIIVVDYDIFWKKKIFKNIISKKLCKKVKPKASAKANIYLIRPTSLRIPIIHYFSILPTYGLKIYHLIKIFQPDIVIGSGILTISLGAYLSKKFKIPYIYFMVDKVHKLIPNKLFQLLGFVLEQYNHKCAEKVIVINEQLKNYSIRMKAPPNKTYIIRAGVETDLFRDDLKNRELMRKKFNFSEDNLVLFFMGWLYKFSGLKEVITKINQLKDPKIRLFILGKGDLKSEIIDMIQKFKLFDSIIIHDWVPYRDLPRFISMSDICLLPAYQNEIMNEIVPIKLYEYLAMGKPVISTYLKGIYKEFRKNNGVIYINSPEEAVDKALILKDKNLIDQIGIQGRKFILENCNWDKLVEDFISILNK